MYDSRTRNRLVQFPKSKSHSVFNARWYKHCKLHVQNYVRNVVLWVCYLKTNFQISTLFLNMF